MLLAFAGNWDATAVGTLALAVVTGVSLAFGWKSLRQGQREVEEAHRPVVMPLVRKTSMDFGADGRTHKTVLTLLPTGQLVVPVARCDEGDVVLGGGYASREGEAWGVVASEPDLEEQSWSVQFNGEVQGVKHLEVYAVCAE